MPSGKELTSVLNANDVTDIWKNCIPKEKENTWFSTSANLLFCNKAEPQVCFKYHFKITVHCICLKWPL